MEEDRQRRAAEKARKNAEMERLNILNYQAVQERIRQIARAREEARRAREEAKRKKAARHPLQDLWDRNGAAIYDANQAFKEAYGKNMNARERRKAIKDATVGGVFSAGAYAGNLVKAATPPPPPPPNPYAGAADRIRAAANEIEDEKKIGYQDAPLPKKPSYVVPDMSWKRDDIRAMEKYQEDKELQEGLRAYYEGRKDGESALSQLIYKFTYNPNSESETALVRMKHVLEETGSGSYINFGNIPMGDTGFARKYQDGTIWPQLPDFENQPGQQGSDNQVGHFLTAVNLSIQVQEKPWYTRWVYKNIFLSAIIGHELIGDDFGGALNKMFPISPVIQTLVGINGGHYARRLFLSGEEQQLEELLLSGGKLGVGNSLEDLRLSYQGWISGEKLVNGEFDTPKDYAEWLEENLR